MNFIWFVFSTKWIWQRAGYWLAQEWEEWVPFIARLAWNLIFEPQCKTANPQSKWTAALSTSFVSVSPPVASPGERPALWKEVSWDDKTAGQLHWRCEGTKRWHTGQAVLQVRQQAGRQRQRKKLTKLLFTWIGGLRGFALWFQKLNFRPTSL